MQKKTENKYSAPLVEKMLNIVEYMADSHHPVGVTDLSRALGLSSNSVFRIMRCLSERGYAEMEPDSRNYILGSKFFTLGQRISQRFTLRKKARPHLESLCRQVEESVQMHILNNDHMMIMDVVSPEMPFFFQAVPGCKVNFHANAYGKCVLAFKEKREIKKLLPKTLEKCSENTITDRDELIAQLAEVRKNGLAHDREEYCMGIYCIGAPVLDVNNEAIAGIGVTGLKFRFHEENMIQFERHILITAARIASDIGYSGDYYKNCLALLKD